MPKVAFLFPGQGAQAVGMGKELCANRSVARELFERASDILGYDLPDVCFHGPQERLSATDVCQPAVFVASWAALEVLRQDQPDLVASCQAAAGLSLGEYTAVAFADAVTFEEALRVVQLRGKVMQAAAERRPGGMVSIIGLPPEQVELLCARARQRGGVWMANLLGPENVAVSGDREALEVVRQLAEAEGSARVVPLAVSGAFHTELMRPADEQLAVALTKISWRPLRLPVICNVDARPHQDPGKILDLLLRQVLSPVLWEQSMRRLLDDGFDQFYEIGPGRVLRGLLRRIERKVQCESIPA